MPAEKKLEALRHVYPGYFALVMATGIVSMACFLLNIPLVAHSLFYINIAAYLILWLVYGLRLRHFFPQVLTDFTSHEKGPAFFTLVAGTCVLGVQFILIGEAPLTGAILWGWGILLWLGIIYSFLTLLIGHPAKPGLDSGINGTWLIMVVATQSVSVLGTLVSEHFQAIEGPVLFFSLMMYLLGALFYIILITLFFYRFLFFKVDPSSLNPPYWVSMGAVAITTLAGARLVLFAPHWYFLGDILSFLKGFTLLFWTVGTWLIPLIITLGIWRHLYHRYPLQYSPQFWSAVFPLGMYTVATLNMARAFHLPFLYWIPEVFVFIALGAWLATFIGLILHLVTESGPLLIEKG